jgi:hypothetical protein
MIFLLCGILAVLATLVSCQKKKLIRRVEFVEQHRNVWIDFLTNNNEARLYLEQLYVTEDRFHVRLENGELTLRGFRDGELITKEWDSYNDLEKLKELFEKLQWESIGLFKGTNIELEFLRIILPQLRFRRYFCGPELIYSPNNKPDMGGGVEIFPDWYYIMRYNLPLRKPWHLWGF